MLIAAISDMHDNEPNLIKCLEWVGKHRVEAIVCCGDAANIDTIRLAAKKFPGPIHLVRGNCDNYDTSLLTEISNIAYHGRTSRIEIDNIIIGICHQPFLISQVLGQGRCDFVFYGHTHKPWIENRGGVIIANPGTLGGMFQKSTFAVLDSETRKLELKILERL